MSGSGVIAAATAPRRTAEEERADTLAYLARRLRNAITMEHNASGFSEQGRDRRRQIEVIERDIAQGLHEGAALVEADIAAGAQGAERTDG